MKVGFVKVGGEFWFFDGPHEDYFAEVLEEKIREVEKKRHKRTEKEPP